MTDTTAFEAFLQKWTSPKYPPDPVAPEDLAALETRFGITLPASYRRFVLTIGLPRPTSALLHTIVERGLDIADVSDFHDPAKAVDITESWRSLGMPGDLVAFASDGSGNQFCFSADDPTAGPIWFFDHDFGTVEQVADSFDGWMGAFCAIEPEGD